jgi:zinc/manganese transport system substrate-binding protein
MSYEYWQANHRGLLAAVVVALATTIGAAEKLKVAATFSVIGDMAAQVAGDHVVLTTIVGPEGDCELYQPTPAGGRTVAEANLLLMNDLNDEFEPWLDPLLKQAAFRGTKVVVSRGAKTLTGEDEHPITGRARPPAIDQHAWMDPNNGIIYVKNIADALTKSDPANAVDYRARAAAFIKKIQAVDAWGHDPAQHHDS